MSPSPPLKEWLPDNPKTGWEEGSGRRDLELKAPAAKALEPQTLEAEGLEKLEAEALEPQTQEAGRLEKLEPEALGLEMQETEVLGPGDAED